MASTSVKGHKRKGISLETKLKVIEYMEQGIGSTNVGNKLGLNESTVRAIKKSEKAIRQSLLSGKIVTAKASSYCRDFIIEKMENLLAIWIEDLNQKRIHFDTVSIKKEAIRLHYNLMLEEEANPSSNPPKKKKFSASGGWLRNFLERHGFRDLKPKKDTSVDLKAAQEYPTNLAQIIQKEGYTFDQVFNVDDTGLFWKRLPNRTNVPKSQKSFLKTHVTLLLCCNASGEKFIKPLLVNKTIRPRALQGKNLNNLSVHWAVNKKNWVTPENFTEWFEICFIPEVEKYLEDKGQDFKVLVIMNETPGHPLIEHPNVKMVYLPPNTTSAIQPMDLGIASNFKLYYLKNVFESILSKIKIYSKSEFDKVYTKFTIMDCIKCATSAIEELSPSTINESWKSIWPQCFIKPEIPENDIYLDIINLARCVEGFENITREDIDDIIFDRVSEEDAVKVVESDDEEVEEDVEPQIGRETIEEGLRMATLLQNHFLMNDPDEDRAMKFENNLRLCMMNYSDLLSKVKKEEYSEVLSESMLVEAVLDQSNKKKRKTSNKEESSSS